MVFVVTIEGISDGKCDCDVVGVYFTEKEAKSGASEYIDGEPFQKKILKGNPEDKQLMYVEKTKEDPRSIFLSSVECKVPVMKGKGKAKRDPLAPKKNLSAFMLFSKENRSKIKDENPEADFGAIGRKVGEAWAKVTDKQKALYQKKAAKDKERYETETAAYTPTEPVQVEKVKKEKKVAKPKVEVEQEVDQEAEE
jgi:hypothetical protein